MQLGTVAQRLADDASGWDELMHRVPDLHMGVARHASGVHPACSQGAGRPSRSQLV